MVKKVAIVGKASTAVLAPFSNPEWEIWGLAWVTYPREDRTFDPHVYPDSFIPQELERLHEEGIPRAEAKGIPVECHPSQPYTKQLPFPFEKVFEVAGHYFESSIAYILAVALVEGVEEVGLWGVHMELRGEYEEQRANLEYLIGFCRGKGMIVNVCPGAPLLSSVWEAGRYGVDTKNRFRR